MYVCTSSACRGSCSMLLCKLASTVVPVLSDHPIPFIHIECSSVENHIYPSPSFAFLPMRPSRIQFCLLVVASCAPLGRSCCLRLSIHSLSNDEIVPPRRPSLFQAIPSVSPVPTSPRLLTAQAGKRMVIGLCILVLNALHVKVINK
jgi:hypothetical protein